MLIDVTEEDIRIGIPQSPFGCPVARSLCRTIGRGHYISANRVSIACGSRVVATPAPVEAFIEDFDARRSVQPISFELPPLEEWGERVRIVRAEP